MKPGIATSLSIAGVLVAGGAALALNSTVLQAASTVRGTPALAAVAPANADAGIVTPIGEPSASAVANVLTTTAISSTKKSFARNSDPTAAIASPRTNAPSDSTSSEPLILQSAPPSLAPVNKVFQVEEFASITVSVSGRTLSVNSVVFSPGAQYKVTNETSPDYTSVTQDHVRVVMASPNRTVVFSARLMNGQVVAAISDPSSGNLPPRRDRDDDHEDEEDERDEDHEERENDDD